MQVQDKARWGEALDALGQVVGRLDSRQGMMEWIRFTDLLRDVDRHWVDAFRVGTRLAEPIYVTAEVGDLVDAARVTYKPEFVTEADAVVPHGFAFLERPLVFADKSVAALHWSVDVTREGSQGLLRSSVETGTGLLGLYGRASSGVLVPISLCVLVFRPEGLDFGNPIEPTGVPGQYPKFELTRYVAVLWRLAQQRLVVSRSESADRAARRRAKRWGGGEKVVVFTLRRTSREGGGEADHQSANYSHRFIVGAHWHWYWYKIDGQRVRRQRWVGDYIKGDPRKPLVLKRQRVFDFRR